MVSPGPVSLPGQKAPRHAYRVTSKKKYPEKPNPRVAGGTPKIALRKTDRKKENFRVRAKEMDRQEEPSQEVPAREKIRTRLVKRPKIGETRRGKVDSDQKRLRQENRGRQRRGSARGGSPRGQVRTRTRRDPKRKRKRIG